MRPPTSIARQLLYAAAMTTGIALMGMLAGCALPETVLAAPGFPHASRRYVSRTEPTTQRASTSWSDTRPVEKQVASEVLLEAKLIKPPSVEP
jgi:basic membrane lipoprotein Med (substrate-binding protein (PBP1-ABC) superfamily)